MEEESSGIKIPSLLKRLIFTGQLTRVIVYLSAAIPAIIFIFLALFAAFGLFQPFKVSTGDSYFILGTPADFLLIAIFIFTGVFGIYEFLRLHRVHKIDNRFPDFVRDLAESRRAGMTFTKAIMYSSRGNYGVLTSEIQKIARQISWGSSVDNALNAFAKRVNTKLIRRTISLIIEASRSGGNVADVLEAASRDAREIKLIESERRASMLSYIAVIYVAMGVFLLILVVLCKSLLPSMLGTEAASMQASTMMKGSLMKQSDVLQLFFSAALVQSGMMGIVTGIFEEGNIISGVKHTFIMLLIVWLIFKLVVTGV
jgi:flagellar protein FlaJ